ncbi:MAG: ZmpA/ZmpB/ZmpC family metallo-endopeptidase, partial [Clostridium sp.]
MDKIEILKEIIQNKNNKQPRYGMRKLSVGLVPCILGFIFSSSNNIAYANEDTTNIESVFSITEAVENENRGEILDIKEQPITLTANISTNLMNIKDNAGLSSNLVEEIKNINFTDEELTNTLGVSVTISDGYMVKAINMAKDDGKTWANLSKEEQSTYIEKAKAEIKAEKLSGNVYQNEFNTIKQDVNSYISQYGITSASDSLVSKNKHQFILGLAYFEKLYNIPIDSSSTTTLKDKLFEGLTEEVLVKKIIDIGSKQDKELSYSNISNFYRNSIANQFTSQASLDSFIKESVSSDKVDTWFAENLKIIHYIDSELEGGVFNKFAKNASTLNHILPLLNLEKDTIYMIATDGSITYGLYDTYVTKKSPKQSVEEKALEAKVYEIGRAQKSHIDIWKELSGGRIPTKNTIVKDALRIKKEAEDPYKVESNYTASNSWTGKYDTDGLKEFITPFGMYASYTHAGAVAETPDIRMYINRALDYRGLSAYSHEMIHLYTTEYLLGNKQRVDTQVELLPRGLLESLENDEAVFGLNLIYGDRKYTNTSYDRFKRGNIASDIQSYINRQMDLIYSLEIIEANEILKRDDKTNFFKKLSQEPTPDTSLVKNNTQTTDTFFGFSDTSINSIEDLVDNNLVVARYYYQKTTEESNKALNNGYHTIPLFSSFYAAPQNDNGTVGDVSLRRMAFELLAEYGYENGMVAYLSDKYANDAEAVKGIFNGSYGLMSEFKKEMYQRREDKLNDLDDVTFVYEGKNYTQKDINKLMEEAIQADSTNPSNYTISKVEDLKEAVFLAYKEKTNDFREDIYKDKVQESKDIYVKNGQSTSTEGQGTEKAPYESLIHAISQAKDGDRIIFINSIVLTGNSDLVIDKNITIDGKGNSLNLRGQDIILESDTIMKDIEVGFAQDGSSDVGKIYVNDKKIVLDNVSTKLGRNPNQSDIRPILVAGGKTSDLNDEDGAIIQIINATGETRFKEIILGNESGSKSSSTKIEIGENVIVDNKVNLSSADGSKTSGEITIINSSNKVKSFLGGKNADNVNIEISSGVNIYDLKLDKIEGLTLNNNSTASLATNIDSEFLEINNLVIKEDSMLNLNASSGTNVSNANVDGRLTINPTKNKLIVAETLSGTGTIMIDAGNGVFSNEILNKDIIITEKPQAETLRGEFTTNGQVYSLVKKDSGYQIIKENAKQADTIFINIILDRDGDLNTKEVENDYDDLYIGDQIETPYIDKSVHSYIPVIMKDVNLKEYILLPLVDDLNPIIIGEDDTIDFINFWVAKPGNLIIDGKKKPFDITIENDKQIVSYTVEKPENGYYILEDGTKFDENNYGKSIVVATPEKDFVLTLVEEKNTVSQETRIEIIPQPEDKIVYDESKVAGTQDLIVEGESGEKEITEKITRNSNGEIIKTEFVSEKIIKEARPKVITIYTGKTEVED